MAAQSVAEKVAKKVVQMVENLDVMKIDAMVVVMVVPMVAKWADV